MTREKHVNWIKEKKEGKRGRRKRSRRRKWRRVGQGREKESGRMEEREN